MVCIDVWFIEMVDFSFFFFYVSGTLDSDVSLEEDNCYLLETEIVLFQFLILFDRFFDYGSFILDSFLSGRVVFIQLFVRYEVIVKEEEINVFYNVNKVEYKIYGLNLFIFFIIIFEIINISVINIDIQRIENYDEYVSYENVVFSRIDIEFFIYVIVLGRNYYGFFNVSNEDGYYVENQIQNEYGNSYVEEMRFLFNVQLLEDFRGLKLLILFIESDCIFDYGIMIGDGRRGNIFFMFDSADDLDFFLGGRLFSKSILILRLKVIEYNFVGEQIVFYLEYEGLESI